MFHKLITTADLIAVSSEKSLIPWPLTRIDGMTRPLQLLILQLAESIEITLTPSITSKVGTIKTRDK